MLYLSCKNSLQPITVFYRVASRTIPERRYLPDFASENLPALAYHFDLITAPITWYVCTACTFTSLGCLYTNSSPISLTLLMVYFYNYLVMLKRHCFINEWAQSLVLPCLINSITQPYQCSLSHVHALPLTQAYLSHLSFFLFVHVMPIHNTNNDKWLIVEAVYIA